MPLNMSHRKYPVMIACIGEARAPDVQEVKWVAKRILREAFPHVARVRRDDTSFYRRPAYGSRYVGPGFKPGRGQELEIVRAHDPHHKASCSLSDGSARSKSRVPSMSRLIMMSARE